MASPLQQEQPQLDTAAKLRQLMAQSQPQEQEDIDPQQAMLEAVFQLATKDQLDRAEKEAKAVNPQLTDDDFDKMIEAMQNNDIASLMKVTEEAVKRKLEMQTKNRDKELRSARTEGASRGGDSLDDDGPQDMQDAVQRALKSIRGMNA